MLLLACTQNLTICLIGREETGGDEVEEKRGGGEMANCLCLPMFG